MRNWPSTIWISTLGIALVCFASAVVAQEAKSTAASTAEEQLVLGRSKFALPPGKWHTVSLDYQSATKILDAAKHQVGQTMSVQLNDQARTLKVVAYHTASLETTPYVAYWDTNVCETKNTLYKDPLDGNFNFPACLLIDYVTLPVARPASGNLVQLWDWLVANNIEIPTVLLTAHYVKYQGGDYVRTTYFVNPQEFGLPASVERVRGKSEWNATSLLHDPQRVAYVERFKKWGYGMADSAKAAFLKRASLTASLEPIPSVSINTIFEKTPSSLSPTVKSACAALTGAWLGDWGFGKRMLWVREVDEYCTAFYSYGPPRTSPVLSADVTKAVLAFPCEPSVDKCSFTANGDELRAQYGGKDGFIFKKIPAPNVPK